LLGPDTNLTLTGSSIRGRVGEQASRAWSKLPGQSQPLALVRSDTPYSSSACGFLRRGLCLEALSVHQFGPSMLAQFLAYTAYFDIAAATDYSLKGARTDKLMKDDPTKRYLEASPLAEPSSGTTPTAGRARRATCWPRCARTLTNVSSTRRNGRRRPMFSPALSSAS